MGTEIQVSAGQSRRNSMTLADVPKLKRLLECDFLHKMDRAVNKSVPSMVIFSLKNIKRNMQIHRIYRE